MILCILRPLRAYMCIMAKKTKFFVFRNSRFSSIWINKVNEKCATCGNLCSTMQIYHIHVGKYMKDGYRKYLGSAR